MYCMVAKIILSQSPDFLNDIGLDSKKNKKAISEIYLIWPLLSN
ncbi:MAG: hypothetical protein BWZ05_00856 [Bacteroidetes bacterium ADurb.BinA245]|nr:MAG: hypothetical protein BWZ05_00856 [Bacteroidetes bacterium ADurb.BinA245]